MTERVSTLSIDSAIRIAKIIATAPVARLPMITQLFHQASVDLEGLEELIENLLGQKSSAPAGEAAFVRKGLHRGYQGSNRETDLLRDALH